VAVALCLDRFPLNKILQTAVLQRVPLTGVLDCLLIGKTILRKSFGGCSW
jgi:hypothetical protein